MTNVTPIQQPALESLKNALQIAMRWNDLGPIPGVHAPERPFDDIARLIRHAIEGLSEPNLASIQAAATMIREANNDREAWDEQRHARDLASVILRAQVTGEIPKTWSEP